MTTKEFIEKAELGGYKLPAKITSVYHNNYRIAFGDVVVPSINDIFLDPLSWQAVGKVEGWYEERMEIYTRTEGQSDVDALRYVEDNLGVVSSLPTKESDEPVNYWPYTRGKKEWKKEMYRMIDALCEGKTIEEYLSTLFKK